MRGISVKTLENIGETLSSRLAEIGIFTREDLQQIGPTQAYRWMCEKAGKKLPVCYNLYSLEAALKGCDWRQLTDQEKQNLTLAAGSAYRLRQSE